MRGSVQDTSATEESSREGAMIPRSVDSSKNSVGRVTIHRARPVLWLHATIALLAVAACRGYTEREVAPQARPVSGERVTKTLCVPTDANSRAASRQGDSFESNALGPVDACVTVVEYSDFQCVFCRQASRTLREIAARYPNKVRVIAKSFVLPFHRQAPLAHAAALAAGEWGLFWEMRDLIFSHPDKMERENLVEFAPRLGIPQEDFVEVLDSGVFQEQVNEEIEEGKKLGVDGTPTFFVNGVELSGYHPIETFEYHIRRALGLPTVAHSHSVVQTREDGIDVSTFLRDPEEGNLLSFGPERARHVVKIFIDLRSPLGQKAAPVVEAMVARYQGKVRFTFKSFSLGIYHDSEIAHQAAFALIRRGVSLFKVWRRIWNVSRSIDAQLVVRWARELGLDSDDVRKVAWELRESTHATLVRTATLLAKELGVKGSPTAFLNGERYDAVEGLLKVEEFLEESLNTKSRPTLK